MGRKNGDRVPRLSSLRSTPPHHILMAVCRACKHEAPLPVKALIERYGENLLVEWVFFHRSGGRVCLRKAARGQRAFHGWRRSSLWDGGAGCAAWGAGAGGGAAGGAGRCGGGDAGGGAGRCCGGGGEACCSCTGRGGAWWITGGGAAGAGPALTSKIARTAATRCMGLTWVSRKGQLAVRSWPCRAALVPGMRRLPSLGCRGLAGFSRPKPGGPGLPAVRPITLRQLRPRRRCPRAVWTHRCGGTCG